MCGDIGYEGSDTEAAGGEGNKVISIPLYPKLQPNGAYPFDLETNAYKEILRSTDLEYSLGEIATALNGVSIFSGATSATTLLEIDTCMSEWTGVLLIHY